VALKQAVDAWSSAPAAEKATRFASAEAIRWLEWGTNSYWNFMPGLALVLFAIVIVWTARIPRPIGYLMGCRAWPSPPGTRTRNRLIKRPSHLAFYASRTYPPGVVLNSFFGFWLLAARHFRRRNSAKFASLGVKWVSNR
jgi:hypothetical protein